MKNNASNESEQKSTSLDYDEVKTAATVLHAVNHKKLRQRIIQLINEQGIIRVTDIYVKLYLLQSVASQQLAILRKANIVTVKRDRKEMLYSLNHKHIENIALLVQRLQAENEQTDEQ
jgi:DNA-binding transcriptional ArsR family regulator